MHSHARKYIALALSLSLAFLCLFGCAKKEPTLYETVVGTAGEYDILYDELRFNTMAYKQILDLTYGDGDSSNGTIWDDQELAEKYRAELEEKVLTKLTEDYRVLAACSAYGIGRDVLEGKGIQDRVDQQYKSAMSSFSSEDAFIADMESNYTTERLYRFYLARELMKYELLEALREAGDTGIITDQTEFAAWIEEEGNCVYVQHIFLEKKGERDPEGLRQIAKEVSISLQNKETTIDLYVPDTKYNDDLLNVAPYYVIPGTYDPAIVSAAGRLYQVGDASDVIETEKGFYVLQRIEEPEGDRQGKLTDLFDSYLWTMIGAHAVTFGDEGANLNDFGKDVDLVAMQ